MSIKFEGQVLKFGTVDKCNRKFAPDCKITFPEKIPVAYNFDMDEIIGHGQRAGRHCLVSGCQR